MTSITQISRLDHQPRTPPALHQRILIADLAQTNVKWANSSHNAKLIPAFRSISKLAIF